MSNVRLLDFRLIFTVLLSAAFAYILSALLPAFARNPLFLMTLPMVGVFFLFLVAKPRLMFAVLLIIRPFLDAPLRMTSITIGGQDVTIGAGVNLVIILLAIFLAFYERNFPRWNRVMVCWVIFLIIMLAPTIYSPFQGRAIRLYANYLSYFAMFLIPFLVIKTKEDFVYWLKILAISFALTVLYTNVDLIHGGRYHVDAGNRIRGTFTFPTILGFYLVLGFTFYFYLLKAEIFKLKPNIILAIKFLMMNMVILMIASKTRNAWIACLGIFFIYGILKDKKMLVVLLLLLPLSLLSPQVRERTLTVVKKEKLNNYEGMDSFEWRVEMWKSSFPKIAKKPLQGYGLTSFLPLSAEFSTVGKNGAHNVYIETLFETGIFGLISLIALLFTPLVIFFNYARQAKDLFQGRLWAIVVGYVASYIIICAADNLSYYLVVNWYVWFFIGLMMVAKKFMEPDLKPLPQAQN